MSRPACYAGSPAQIAALPPDVRHGLAEAFAHAFRGVFLWGLRESVGEAAPVTQPLAE